MKIVRQEGISKLPRCKRALLQIGVFPIRNHYYEPQFDFRQRRRNWNDDRNLPGIDWNVPGQLKMLGSLVFSHELAHTPRDKQEALGFYLDNGTFESGDAECWYQIIRAMKPKRIIEIGSGNSTLMAVEAIRMNTRDDSNYNCDHICIEPYEKPWLDRMGIQLVRKKVEDIEVSFFSRLKANDILFIDSSHIIRPQGDVLFEYLELLPSLNAGVIVHVHDIFSPKDYPARWLDEKVLFWNEQYLLEAFLSHNRDWQVIAAINYLHHNHHDRLKSVAPFLTREREPGSFYIQRVT